MFCTFTTEHGTLVVRTQDIRRIEDRPAPYQEKPLAIECIVVWVETEHDLEVESRIITGTAAENLARLIAEDRERSAAYAATQQRLANGMPVPPILRGKAAQRG